MPEVFSVAIFFIVIVITAMLFIGWVAFVILRGIINGIAGLFHPPRPRAQVSDAVHCPTRGCGASNPPIARFCRRCGHELPAAQRVNVRRAAVW